MIFALQKKIGHQKTITSNANKLLKMQTLLKSIQYSAKRYFDAELSREILEEKSIDEADDLLSTTVKLKLNLMDIRELRKRYNQNYKVIKELLGHVHTMNKRPKLVLFEGNSIKKTPKYKTLIVS